MVLMLTNCLNLWININISLDLTFAHALHVGPAQLIASNLSGAAAMEN